MKQIITFYLCFFIPSIILAQAPEAFNYQGVARDLTGKPLTGKNISLQISILQTSTSGSEVYKEKHTTKTNELGLFQLQIGSGLVQNGNFENIDWGGDSFFLQVEMDAKGGNNYQLMGTNRMVSVPYALHAGNGSLWNKNMEGIDYTAGKVGIGTNDPVERLTINGDDELRDGLISDALVSINNNNYSRYRASTYSDRASHNSQLEGVRGRGTIEFPSAVMPHDRVFGVYGLVHYNNDVHRSPISSMEYFVGDDIPSGIITFSTLSVGQFRRDERMRIDEVGNVGIGTNDPRAKLQVKEGNIFIEDINSGIIMKSPNGQCWMMTVTNSGNPSFRSVNCPN